MPCSKSVQRLPDEFLIQIASYITCRRTLAALSLCCKQLHTIVEPLLYSNFVQTGEGATALPTLLRTSSRKPHLGLYVKAVVARSENEVLILHMEIQKRLAISHATITVNTFFVQLPPASFECLVIKDCSNAIYDAMVASMRVNPPKNLKKVDLIFKKKTVRYERSSITQIWGNWRARIGLGSFGAWTVIHGVPCALITTMSCMVTSVRKHLP